MMLMKLSDKKIWKIDAMIHTIFLMTGINFRINKNTAINCNKTTRKTDHSSSFKR